MFFFQNWYLNDSRESPLPPPLRLSCWFTSTLKITIFVLFLPENLHRTPLEWSFLRVLEPQSQLNLIPWVPKELITYSSQFSTYTTLFIACLCSLSENASLEIDSWSTASSWKPTSTGNYFQLYPLYRHCVTRHPRFHQYGAFLYVRSEI